jgi:hypothetical protein
LAFIDPWNDLEQGLAELAPEIPPTRISLNENWRRGIRIVHRT